MTKKQSASTTATSSAKAPSSRPPAPRPRPRTPTSPPACPGASLQDRIAIAAYFRAEKAGFVVDPVENWLAAERDLQAQVHPAPL